MARTFAEPIKTPEIRFTFGSPVSSENLSFPTIVSISVSVGHAYYWSQLLVHAEPALCRINSTFAHPQFLMHAVSGSVNIPNRALSSEKPLKYTRLYVLRLHKVSNGTTKSSILSISKTPIFKRPTDWLFMIVLLPTHSTGAIPNCAFLYIICLTFRRAIYFALFDRAKSSFYIFYHPPPPPPRDQMIIPFYL